MRAFTFSLMLGLAAIGCGSTSDEGQTGDEQDVTSTPPSADESRACAEGSVKKNGKGDMVVSCTKPFSDGEAIRLPKDTDTTFYAGITLPTGGDVFVVWTRDGKRYAPVDDAGKAIAFHESKKLPAGLHAPTNRVTFTIYQVTGKPGTTTVDTAYGPATAIRLSAARAVVELDGCTFDSRLAGTWEGTVSERLETPQGGGPFAKAFDESKRLPIHVTLDVGAKFGNLLEFDGKSSTDQAAYKLLGTIDNFDRDFEEGGKKYPSLTAMGAKNPFKGATNGKIELYRLGNMHGVGNDGHWVLTYPVGSESLTLNGMSFTLTGLTAPSFMTKAEPLDHLEIKPHLPFVSNGHSVLLKPVKVGAKTAQCPR